MATKKKPAKIAKVMGEYKRGTLKSSSGKKVTKRSQAVAIAMSEAGMSKDKKPPFPKGLYDNPNPRKRQPRDKDDAILDSRGRSRGRKAVLRRPRPKSVKA